MKKIDDKKIKGISIELDKSTKLKELDDTILDFKKKTDDKYELDVSVDIQNATLHMKRVKKPYISLATSNSVSIYFSSRFCFLSISSLCFFF